MNLALNRGLMDTRGYMRYISYKSKIVATTENILFIILTVMWYLTIAVVCPLTPRRGIGRWYLTKIHKNYI
jgi:hypothetical protein